MRVLIADFDFFTAVGGGQTLYRRLVERNPDIEFWYPSRGRDARDAAKGWLPANARPYAFDPHAVPGSQIPFRVRGLADSTHGNALAKIALPIQGMVFDAIDVPSFFPCAHLVRPVLAAYGIALGRVVLGLVGWPSVSVRHGYRDDCSDDLADKLRVGEELAIRASDMLYSIEGLHADDSSTLRRPLVNLALSNVLEDFPAPAPRPPGEGPPDIWYVGRLDRTKGPDLFLDMVARIPRALYRNCYFTGPDNRSWSPNRSWSEKLADQAAGLGLDAVYRGQISDAELRQEVYGGRSLVVVPSRSDVINYVALEALSGGCPILLSKHAGASDYLGRNRPEVLPPIIDPEDSPAAAAALADLLTSYEARACDLRRIIRDRPLSAYRTGFMRAVYDPGADGPAIPGDLPGPHLLMTPAAAAWRPVPAAPGQGAAVSVVVTVRDRPAELAATLAALRRQTAAPREIVVVDDGSRDPAVIRGLIRHYPGVTLIRQGRQGPAWAANAGWKAAAQPLVAFLGAGDLPAPDLLASALAALAADAPFPAYRPEVIAAPAATEIAGDPMPDPMPDPGPGQYRGRSGAGLVIRRSALARLGGFEPGRGANAAAHLLAGLAEFGTIREAPRGAPGLWQLWPEQPDGNGAGPPPGSQPPPAPAQTDPIHTEAEI